MGWEEPRPAGEASATGPALTALGPPGSQPRHPPPTSGRRSHTLLTTPPTPPHYTFWKGPSLCTGHALQPECFSLTGLPRGWVPAQPQRITLGTTSPLP